jgi:hypothetical protein
MLEEWQLKETIITNKQSEVPHQKINEDLQGIMY